MKATYTERFALVMIGAMFMVALSDFLDGRWLLGIAGLVIMGFLYWTATPEREHDSDKVGELIRSALDIPCGDQNVHEPHAWHYDLYHCPGR